MSPVRNSWGRYLRRTRPALLARIGLAAVLLAPVWLVALAWSLAKTARWRNPALCRKFMERHRLAFQNVDPGSLRVQPVPGGVSNAGFVWRCEKLAGGGEALYFVKVFLPMGTLWAKLLPRVGPFPSIEAVNVHQRLGADLFARGQLGGRGIAVPECVAVGPAEGIVVGEFLDGRMVHDVLADIQRAGCFMEDDRIVLSECGRGLGRIHEAGFSLIDAQPANCMWVPERRRLYFLDMEYFTRRDERNWDLTFFLAFITAQLSGRLESEARELVLQGYWSRRRPAQAPPSENLPSLEDYRPVFQAILDLRRLTPEQMFG